MYSRSEDVRDCLFCNSRFVQSSIINEELSCRLKILTPVFCPQRIRERYFRFLKSILKGGALYGTYGVTPKWHPEGDRFWKIFM